MPLIGFGTFQSETNAPPGTYQAAVLEALRIGIRHLDTAWCYGTEEEVGEAIRESGIPREELFVVTNLYQTFHRPEDVAKAFESSLKSLGLDYIDLHLMHFPYAYIPRDDFSVARGSSGKPTIDCEFTRDYISTWQAMENLVDTKKARAIDVSNFSVLKTKLLLAHS
ncbi:Similar to Protein GCY; acc. no. P14065 [Pyronema omphalodes CBS 100304]|uniref:Similar to Protein GCY acc. no. P14065 n=1 Tax=Pyronema omphalodes (strain CBS 100304) TaxID=1076935 RepID=U4L5Q4_PYROM|nr:Similar to Protein GCY; acc. no. P14065 [Pyronema omphalodes CBS 100304]